MIRVRNHRQAFTLIEILVVVAIIALLIAILLPSLSRAQEQTRRGVCASNARQINMACAIRAETDKTGIYIAATSTGDDSLNHVYPKYLPSAKTAICPSTKNIVRENVPLQSTTERALYPKGLQDLRSAADNAADADGGHSYEMWGWYDGPSIYPDGTKIDGKSAGTYGQQLGWPDPSTPGYNNATDGDVIKKHRSVKKPQNTLLALDNDQGGGSTTGDIWNFPDAYNNHGPDGLNVAFLDLHVQFVKPMDVIRVYMRSYADPPSQGLWTKYAPWLRQKSENGFTVYYTVQPSP
ncbi:MAG: prepilin-type N-terminal cleavage/methylation domain-containing protein [Phycisphaerae bacterium]|nr:prepilin-type N-terminal cleavage/methylation domain-containing protein [Phycisphaerae bacterium]